MKNKILKALSFTAIGAASVFALHKQVRLYFSDENNKRKLQDQGDRLAQKVVKKIANAVCDNSIPAAEYYESKGFLAGNTQFLQQPAGQAQWKVGFGKGNIIPEKVDGDLFVGGYLVFPANKVSGFMTDQLIRVIAIEDGSARGIHIFAVIDCIGISSADVRQIRLRLQNVIASHNILSLNISATHCHSGVDTMGLWGDLLEAVRKNPRALRNNTPEKKVNGKNPAFMENLYSVAQTAITDAVQNMKPGTLSFAVSDASAFSRDKRAPFVKDDLLTTLRFVPDDGSKILYAVFFAAHPVCYGSHQTVVSADFPYYMCREFDECGFDSLFFQGAQAAIATNRGPHIPEGISRDEGIAEYGKAIARFVLSAEERNYKTIEPMLNVAVREVQLPCDNAILELAGKIGLINNNMVKISENEYQVVTELGFAQFGKTLHLALIPGEMMPEILTGGTVSAAESYNGTEWPYPSMRSLVNGHLAVVGLCNDHVGYIVPDNDFGSIFAPDRYEESVSLGSRCASGLTQAFAQLLSQNGISRKEHI